MQTWLHGVVERNRISSLRSHEKALEKECCPPGVFCDSGDTPVNINVEITVENANLCGKICDVRTFLKYAENAAIAYSHKTDNVRSSCCEETLNK